MIDCVNACNLDAKRAIVRKLLMKAGLLPKQPEGSCVASLKRVTLQRLIKVGV
jgi:hypothetical protein